MPSIPAGMQGMQGMPINGGMITPEMMQQISQGGLLGPQQLPQQQSQTQSQSNSQTQPQPQMIRAPMPPSFLNPGKLPQ